MDRWLDEWIRCFLKNRFFVCYFKGPSRDGHWKLAKAINAMMLSVGLLYNPHDLYLSLSNKPYTIQYNTIQLNQWHEVSLQTLNLIALTSIPFRPKITVLNRHSITMRWVSGVINTGASVRVCGGSSAAEPVLLVDFSSQVAPAAHVGLKVTMSRRRTLSVRQLNVIKGHVSWMSGAGLHTFNRYLTHNNNT